MSDLRRIASNTGLAADSARNKSELVDLCCRHLSKPAGIGERFQALDSAQKEFVIALAAEGGELLETEAIEELCGGWVHQFYAIMTCLSGSGLVFKDAATLGSEHRLVGLPDPMLKAIPIPSADQGRLRAVMKSRSVGLLRAFSVQLGMDLRDLRRPFLVQGIRDHLLDPDRLKSYVNSLSDQKRTLLDRLLRDGDTTQETVRRDLGEDTVRQLGEMIWKTPLFQTQAADLSQETSPIHLASDLSLALQSLAESQDGRLEGRPEEILGEAEQEPGEIKENRSLFQDLANLLGLIARRRPPALKTGGIARSVLREARRHCRGEEDPGYTEFLMLFVEEARLARLESEVWRPAADAGERLESEADIQKAMFAFWQETDRWNEWRAEGAKRKRQHSRVTALKRFRQEILQGLRRCGVGRWIAYHRFYRLLLKSSEPFRTYVEHPRSGRTLAAPGTTAEELLRRILTGVLTWTGLIRLGHPEGFNLPLRRDVQPLFQITQRGEALLRGDAKRWPTRSFHSSNPEARIVLQPNFEVLSPPDLPHTAYIRLWTLADLKSNDIVTHFQITRDSLREGMNVWPSGAAIRTFLQDYSATGIPDVLENLIQECESRHGEIEIGWASGYLSVDSSELLNALYAQKPVAEMMGPRTSPTSGVLKPHTRPETLLRMLQKEGYMPKLIDESIDVNDGPLVFALNGSDLLELVAFLETATKTLREQTSDPPQALDLLLSRLKRALRQFPDRQRRIDAASRYRKAFQELRRPSAGESGVQDLLRYVGQNPASDPVDIRAMVRYAIDHRLCVEIHYPSIDVRHVIEPVAEDPTTLYAISPERRGDRIFRIEKVGLARLTGERFRPRHQGATTTTPVEVKRRIVDKCQ